MKESKTEISRSFRFLAGPAMPLLAVLFFLGCPPFNLTGAIAEGLKEAAPPAAAGGGAGEEKAADAAQVSLPPPLLVQGPRFALFPQNARPGEPVTVAYSGDFRGVRNLQAVLVDSGGKRLVKSVFFSLPREEGEEELKAAVLAVPSTASSGNAVIRVESADGIIRDFSFLITPRDFPSEIIELDGKNTDIRTRPDPQKTLESEQLWAVLSRTGTEIYSNGLFRPPVSSTRRTSEYGHRRIYEYIDGKNDSAIHAGVDYGIPTGTEIRACARGRVVLAKSRIVTGNTVILEHLPGVYSLYYHLDSIAVSEGTVAEAGFVLGHSGSTGLATGPHLHWEIRVSGENTDPDVFLSRPVLDKTDILTKLTN